MHIMTRQVNEGVVIGEGIEVTVLEIGPNFVRLEVTEPGAELPCREHLLFLDDETTPTAAFQNRPRFF